MIVNNRFFLLIQPIFFMLFTLSSCATLHKTRSKQVLKDQLTSELDPYRNHHIKNYSDKFKESLKRLVDHFKAKKKRTSLYIHQSPTKALDISYIKSLGFEYAEYNRERDEILWILDNGRGVTHIGSSVSGAGIIVRNRKNEALFILNPDHKMWVLPSGGTDRGELIRDSAVRELKEEVGLDAKVEDLMLVLMTNSSHAMGRKGLNSINHFYLLDRFSGSPKTSAEAPKIAWIKIKDLSSKKIHQGMRLHPQAPMFAKSLERGYCVHSQRKTIKNGILDISFPDECKKK